MKAPLPKLEPILDCAKKNTAIGSFGMEISRRSFLLYAGLGTAGAALLLSSTGDMFASNLLIGRETDPGASVSGTEQDNTDLGEIRLDGLMMTYFSIPPGFASSVFTFGKNFSTNLTLKIPSAPGIVLTGTAESGGPVLAENHSQRTSSWVKDAIILGSASELGANGRNRRFSAQQGSDPLQIYGFRNPRLRLSGRADRLQFCFSDLGQRSFNLGREVSTETAASMYSQYVTDPARLFPPRFYWLDVVGGEGATAFDFVLPSKLLVRNGITATVTVKIVDQTGFQSRLLREAFAPGNDVQITYHSAQEFHSKNLMELQTTPLESDTRIYIDRVFKTFVMTERPGVG